MQNDILLSRYILPTPNLIREDRQAHNHKNTEKATFSCCYANASELQ